MNEGESKRTHDQPDAGTSEGQQQNDKDQNEPILDSIIHEMTHIFNSIYYPRHRF